ncbi:winged helix-turn-helix domain-containing protein [Sphingomonas solaris]|uniref:Response regulator transcription factor n=1 Tax=Alterirhizorhabdus solaris TaxID=2529389 RepID=A0A558QRI2_9SPHN|nr:winged helix-turn-helix domain-containing protein [Sphingomonas solaris]TVV69745.1 response regulator transcription factor [Sphingomonas solaris]
MSEIIDIVNGSAPAQGYGFAGRSHATDLNGLLVSDGSRLEIRSIEKRIPMEFGVYTCSTVNLKRDIRYIIGNNQFVFFDNTNNKSNVFSLIKETRSLSIKGLSIVAFSSNDERSIINNLEWGADECIIYSMSDAQIEARLFSHYRSKDKFDFLEKNGIIFSLNGLIINGVSVNLSNMEMSLFKIFLYRIGEILSREELCLAVWGKDKESVGRSLDVHISKLRDKAFIVPKTNLRLVSVYGSGYKLQMYDLAD